MLEEIIIKLERVLLYQIIVSFSIFRLHYVAVFRTCVIANGIGLFVARVQNVVSNTHSTFMRGYSVLLLDQTLGRRIMFICTSTLVVIFKENLIKDVLLTVGIPNLQLLPQQVYALVHQGNFIWLDKCLLETLWNHRFLHLYFFYDRRYHYLCARCV